jgi:hypothetical protein
MANIPMWTTPQLKAYHTHGRRYGLQNVLRYFRAHGLGCGALNGKASLMGARVPFATPGMVGLLRGFVPNPFRGLLSLYSSYYREIGRRRYLRLYVVDERGLSRPRVGAATALPTTA